MQGCSLKAFFVGFSAGLVCTTVWKRAYVWLKQRRKAAVAQDTPQPPLSNTLKLTTEKAAEECAQRVRRATLRQRKKTQRKREQEEEGEEEEEEEGGEEEEEEEEEEIPPHLAGYSALKMVLCVRMDLKMGTGKKCAQCGHAAVGAVMALREKDPNAAEAYVWQGGKKIAVKIRTEEQMEALTTQAERLGLNMYTVYDAGLTQIQAGSRTVLAVGPGPEEEVDKVTRSLTLL